MTWQEPSQEHHEPPVFDPYPAQDSASSSGAAPWQSAPWPHGVPEVLPPRSNTMALVMLVAFALLVMAVVGGGIAFVLFNDDGESASVAERNPVERSPVERRPPPEVVPTSACPPPRKRQNVDAGTENLVLEECPAAATLYPAQIGEPTVGLSTYNRIAYGRVSCDASTDSTVYRGVITEARCTEVLVGAYVDEGKSVVVTVGSRANPRHRRGHPAWTPARCYTHTSTR